MRIIDLDMLTGMKNGGHNWSSLSICRLLKVKLRIIFGRCCAATEKRSIHFEKLLGTFHTVGKHEKVVSFFLRSGEQKET